MNKLFILLVVLVATALAVPKTYAECRKELKKLKVVCKECKEGKTESKKCKAAAKVAGSDCAILKKCYKDVDDRDKKQAKKDANALDAKYGRLCPRDRRQCFDRTPQCQVWANRNPSECTQNSGFMLATCPGSCCPICTGRNTLRIGSCPKKDRWDLCVPNEHRSCDTWANPGKNKRSECKKNPKWMKLNCMQSCCSACKRDANNCPTVQSDCSNKYKKPSKKKGNASCVSWAQNGECRSNPKWMNKNCARECCPICNALEPAFGMPYPQQQFLPQNNFPMFGGYRVGR